jgi:hypothetical protein
MPKKKIVVRYCKSQGHGFVPRLPKFVVVAHGKPCGLASDL